MPVAEPTQQLGLCAVWLVIGEFVLVRGAPPGSAAKTDRNKSDAKTLAKRLGEHLAGGMIANAAPTLIASINRFSVIEQLCADP